jgi:pSer/pThr/pTyr-binding forkhead associated (FHA) protein
MSSEPAIDPFLSACGMAGPLVLELEERRVGTIQRLVYHQPFVVVGRMPNADLWLDDEQVSRRHAYLQVVNGRLYGVDLASRTGIHWDDGTHGSGWLNQDRSLAIGPYVIRIRDGLNDRLPTPPSRSTRAPAPPTASVARQKQLPRVVLEFPGRSVAQPPWRMNRMLALVGRSPECKVLLSGNDISLFHCSLVRTTAGVWVVDLLARDGSRINGQAVRAALLEDGDELQIGHYRIQLRYGSSIGQAAPRASRPPLAAPAPSPPALPAAETVMAGGMPMPDRPGLPALPDIRGLLAGRSPEQVELAESLLVPVVQQFGQMHQQMFDQFQQMMMMAFQMFATMHRDQMSVVRDELAQIRRLTDELHTLQDQVRTVIEQQRGPAATPAPAAAVAPAPAPAPDLDPDRSEDFATIPPAPAPERPAARATQPETAAADAADGRPQPIPEVPWDPQGGLPNLHAQLARRIASLQQERQSRWQKLLNLMSGGGGQSGRGQPGS